MTGLLAQEAAKHGQPIRNDRGPAIETKCRVSWFGSPEKRPKRRTKGS